jgi:excisionase family DNA binding protein
MLPEICQKSTGVATPQWVVRQILHEQPGFARISIATPVLMTSMKRTLMRQSETKNVLTVAEVAEILRVHSTTIYRLVKRGELPGFKLGGNWRINRASLDLWLLAERPQNQFPRDN